jgi:hypothetical protein
MKDVQVYSIDYSVNSYNLCIIFYVNTKLSSSEVKNEWSCNAIPPICLRGVDINKFALYKICIISPFCNRNA